MIQGGRFLGTGCKATSYGRPFGCAGDVVGALLEWKVPLIGEGLEEGVNFRMFSSGSYCSNLVLSVFFFFCLGSSPHQGTRHGKNLEGTYVLELKEGF